MECYIVTSADCPRNDQVKYQGNNFITLLVWAQKTLKTDLFKGVTIAVVQAFRLQGSIIVDTFFPKENFSYTQAYC